MKVTLRPLTSALGLAVVVAALTPNVFAGCGEMPGKAAPAGKEKTQVRFMQAAYRPARWVLVDAPDGAEADVVGLWHVVFTQNSAFGGGLFDDSLRRVALATE